MVCVVEFVNHSCLNVVAVAGVTLCIVPMIRTPCYVLQVEATVVFVMSPIELLYH